MQYADSILIVKRQYEYGKIRYKVKYCAPIILEKTYNLTKIHQSHIEVYTYVHNTYI